MSSNQYSEEQSLVNACVAGQADAWDSFMQRYDRLIRATIVNSGARWGAGRNEKDDIVGHVYEKLLENDYRRLSAWRQRSSFSTYLVQVSKNLCFDYLRAHRRRMERQIQMNEEEIQHCIEQSARQAKDAASGEKLERLQAAIDKLPPKQALIMVLRLEGKSLRAIAKVLKLPHGTVFGENSRAIEMLRRMLEREDFDVNNDSTSEEIR